MKNKIKLIGILLLLGCSTPGITADKSISFPPEIKPLITEEMQALQQGMREIVPALVSGNWAQLEEIGRHMRDSYIIKQKLTKAQKKALKASLPGSFKKVDKAFHESAGELSSAAKERNMEQVIFYYVKMTEACVSCHSQHARQRFPTLGNAPKEMSLSISECSTVNQLAIALSGGDVPEKCIDPNEKDEDEF